MKRVSATFAGIALVMLTACSTPNLSEIEPAVDTPLGDAVLVCMDGLGQAARLDWSGGLVAKSGEVTDEWNAAAASCLASTGWGDLTRLSSAQVAELYGQEVKSAACLSEHGYSPQPPPTSEEYVASFLTDDQYLAIDALAATFDDDDLQKAVALCPPPTWFLNVG